MKKVIVNILLMDENGVIDCSFKGIQFTGVMNEEFIFAKCVYGKGPEYVQIPIGDILDKTEEYRTLQDFCTVEMKIPQKISVTEKLQQYFNLNLTDELKKFIDETIKVETKAYQSI